MNIVTNRSDLCKAHFEDFESEQCGIECPTCHAAGVSCLGGSHPRRQQGKLQDKALSVNSHRSALYVFIILMYFFAVSIAWSFCDGSIPSLIVSFLSVRSSTLADESAVYGIVLQRNGDVKAVIGTAFAISGGLAISAWHNFTDNGYLPTDVVILCKEIKASVILRSSPVVAVLDHDVDDDWVTLQLVSTVFPSHVTLCPEAEMPPARDVAGQSRVVGVKYFPSSLINFHRHVTVISMHAKIWNYSASFVQRPVKKLRLEDQFPLENECMVNVWSDGVLGSCGAPYFAENGKVFAFHVRSIPDASYSEGRVLARLISFTTKYPHLF